MRNIILRPFAARGAATALICTLSALLAPPVARAQQAGPPNIILVLCDQFRADACAREGFALNTTPFLDSLARDGAWFNRAYCAAPACVPSRTAMLTGRFPSATRVRSNHNIPDAVYSRDLIDVLKGQGYQTAIIGKTGHSFLQFHPERFDYFKTYTHLGEPGPEDSARARFNAYLRGTHFYADTAAAPFPASMEQPARIVSDGIAWLSARRDSARPFFMYLSIPEPHNPYQVPEPYFSLFPPEQLPPMPAGAEALPAKGKKFTMLHRLEQMGYPGFERRIPRIRSNYYGMLRLIDDQLRRLATYLDSSGLASRTVILFVADHGDYTGAYGLIKKGAGVPECLMRIPMIWHGPGIVRSALPLDAHVSNIDILPTICDMIGSPLPDGVIGRSLWPLLSGRPYPRAEFASIIAQQGFGGRDYTAISQLDPYEEGCLARGKEEFDELNSYSQSGILRMLRKGDWKLVYNMQGNGRLYHLSEDPAELHDLYGDPRYADKKAELLADMLAWELRAQDPLPLPRRRYIYRGDPRNYWTPYRDPDVE